MSQIVVAYDIGPEADKVLSRITGIVNPEDHVVLVYVVPEDEEGKFSGFDTDSPDAVVARDHINNGIEVLKENGITAIGSVRHGDPATTIIHLAKELSAKMVIVGASSKGMSGASVGSVAISVVEGCPRPVLVVK